MDIMKKIRKAKDKLERLELERLNMRCIPGNNGSAELDLSVGNDLHTCFNDAKAMIDCLGYKTITFKFNGVNIKVDSRSEWDMLVAQYLVLLDGNGFAYGHK